MVVLANYFNVSLDYLIRDKRSVVNELAIQTDALSEAGKEKIYRIMRTVIREID